MNKYTIEEVALHDFAQDLWIIIHGNVYDLTLFLSEHPGGEEVLLGLAGKDGTECFDNIGHSDEAKLLRERYKIGEVTDERDATTSAVRSKTTSADETEATVNDYDQFQERKKGKPAMQIFVYFTVVIYAIIFYYYYQNM